MSKTRVLTFLFISLICLICFVKSSEITGVMGNTSREEIVIENFSFEQTNSSVGDNIQKTYASKEEIVKGQEMLENNLILNSQVQVEKDKESFIQRIFSWFRELWGEEK